jgi:hypothetical protein
LEFVIQFIFNSTYYAIETFRRTTVRFDQRLDLEIWAGDAKIPKKLHASGVIAAAMGATINQSAVSAVNATVSGSQIQLTAKTGGDKTNYPYSISSRFYGSC